MNYKAAIEAILFTMGESVELGRIADAIQLNEKETKKLLDEPLRVVIIIQAFDRRIVF